MCYGSSGELTGNTHQAESYNTEKSYYRITEIKKMEMVLQEKHAEIARLMIELSKASDPIEIAQLPQNLKS